MCLLTHLNGV